MQVFNLPVVGEVLSVAINNSNQALIGGVGATNRFAAVLAPSSNVAQQVINLSGDGIQSVAD